MSEDHAKTASHRLRDELDDVLTDALCERLKQLTGKEVSEKTREEILCAVRYR